MKILQDGKLVELTEEHPLYKAITRLQIAAKAKKGGDKA